MGRIARRTPQYYDAQQRTNGPAKATKLPQIMDILDPGHSVGDGLEAGVETVSPVLRYRRLA
jgi:hypothetical protein